MIYQSQLVVILCSLKKSATQSKGLKMGIHFFLKESESFNIFDNISEPVVKICSNNSCTYLLTQDNIIYFWKHSSELRNYESIKNIQAIDIGCNEDLLYYVDTQGCVFKLNAHEVSEKTEMVFTEDTKSCIHGSKSPSFKVKIKSLYVSEFGGLFLSTCGQLWASGFLPQISINSSDPRKVTFFEGRTIYGVGLGQDFAVVLTRKNLEKENEQCETDSDVEEDIFLRDCPQCLLSGKFTSNSSCSNDICPLGMAIIKSSDNSSTTSIVNTDKHEESCFITEEDSSSITENEIDVQCKCDLKLNNRSAHGSDTVEIVDNSQTIRSISEQNALNSNNFEHQHEKRESIFDTDAAKHFLSKQLSWVYVGEDYLNEYTEKPTRMLKENVTNFTSLVYEGVKTVGDKVVNLSRHMSKGSDIKDVNFDNFILDEMHSSVFTYCNSSGDEIQASTSTVNEKDIHSNIPERTSILLAWGQNILNSEVWMWGDNHHGQLGTGDNVTRSTPVLVSRLFGCGVQKISCGQNHCSALTLDGRLFLWGKNDSNQLSKEFTCDKSSPYVFSDILNPDRIRDVACGSNHTVIYTLNNNLIYLGKQKNSHKQFKTVDLLNISVLNSKIDKDETIHPSTKEIPATVCPSFKTERNCFHWKLLASDGISYFHKHNLDVSPAVADLAIEQQFLEELLLIYYSLIKSFLKKSCSILEETNIYESLCNSFSKVMYFTAVNVFSLWRFTEGHCDELDICMISSQDEQIKIYKRYLENICDIITINGFEHIATIVEISSVLHSLFTDKLPTCKQNNGKKTTKAIIAFAFLHPLHRLKAYMCLTQSLIRYISKNETTDARANIIKKLKDVISKWDRFIQEVDKSLKEAETTQAFWETSGKVLFPVIKNLGHCSKRRFIRDSKNHLLNVVHSGRFSSHWFVLLSDVLIYTHNNVHNIYHLATLWVEPVPDSDVLKNSIKLITPEETIHVSTNSSEEKIDWLHVLQSAIKCHFNKSHCIKTPVARIACYNFSAKSQFYKDAKYNGRWYNGKMHGNGVVDWPDGKKYTGEFNFNRIHGYGKMEIPNVGTYIGQWKDNLQCGYGVMKYCSGDVHEGYFKDGLAHGHGIRRQGDFTSSSASLYIGDWFAGIRQGYGIMDDIGKGEKYLGNWSDNKKHGCGLIVTLDGIYYEGVFMQDVLTGHGVLVFENGTHYEGEFKSAGTFSGKGILTLSSGDKIEGNLSGSWTDGVKISNATLNLNTNVPNTEQCNSKPNSFGKLCVAPNQKWNALFRECFQQLGIPDKLISACGNYYFENPVNINFDNKKLWHNIAILITQSYQQSLKMMDNGNVYKSMKQEKSVSIEKLQMIPNFAQANLCISSYEELKQYLFKACESLHHPLGKLIQHITSAFNATYGGVRVHPLLLSHAVKELKSITSRIYFIVRLLFPALPDNGDAKVLPKTSSSTSNELNPINGEVVSASTLLQPVLLPCVHPSLFVLYALHNKQEDDTYWRRLLKWNKQPDISLMVFLGIDQKFWVGYTTRNPDTLNCTPCSPLREQLFKEAIETLQQLKTTFSPIEKLLVIRNTFQQITSVVQKALGPCYMWSMDELFPVFHFVVVRAQILQLGSEIHFIDDFLEICMQNGELGMMFTTLKACYFQILQEKVIINM